MANPFDNPPPKHYGSVDGRSSGFVPGVSRDSDFQSRRKEVADACVNINNKTNELRKLCKQLGTRHDDGDLRERINELRKIAFDCVESATEKFNDIMSDYQRTSNQEQNIALNSLQQTFSKAASDFGAVYESVINKLQEHPRPARQTSGGNHTSSINSHDMESDGASLIASDQLQQYDSTQASYAEERAQMIDDLRTDMVQLHDIMGSIQKMVVTQGEAVDQIEAHVEKATVDVDRGRGELGAAVRFKKCNRRLTCIIILVVTVVVLAIIIAIVVFVCISGHCSKK